MNSDNVAFFLCGVGAALFVWCAREAWRHVQLARLRRYCRRVLEQSQDVSLN